MSVIALQEVVSGARRLVPFPRVASRLLLRSGAGGPRRQGGREASRCLQVLHARLALRLFGRMYPCAAQDLRKACWTTVQSIAFAFSRTILARSIRTCREANMSAELVN